jgi:hypothetical protein
METLNKNLLVTQFEKIGARLKVVGLETLPRRFGPDTSDSNNHFNINVHNDKKGEYFTITAGDNVKVTIPNIQKDIKHLLINVAKTDRRNQVTNEKYLCGHDERHWFVAAIPSGGVATVKDAMTKLKPQIATIAQKSSKVRKKDLHKKHNNGYKRQGEWFFIPQPNLIVDVNFIFKNEPIVRSRGGKPHICEELYRRGGTPVMVGPGFPNGLTIPEYEEWKSKASETDLKWKHFRPMTRDAQVFVKGKVTHPDHKTIELIGWHLVVPNTESRANQFKRMAFLD